MPDMYDNAEEDFIVEALDDQDLTDKKPKKKKNQTNKQTKKRRDLYASVWVNDR